MTFESLGFMMVIILLLSIIVHFIPSFIAYKRAHESRGVLLVLNILFGWTIIGWIILLIWAASGQKPIDLCNKCGCKLNEGDVFCMKCGNKVANKDSESDKNTTSNLENTSNQESNTSAKGVVITIVVTLLLLLMTIIAAIKY